MTDKAVSNSEEHTPACVPEAEEISQNENRSSSSSKHLLYSEHPEMTDSFLSKVLNSKTKSSIQFSESSVLNKIRDFLPTLKKAQDELERKDPIEYNIELVEEDKPVIEVDLALFVQNCEDDGVNESDCDSDKSEDYSEEPNSKEAKSCLIVETDDNKYSDLNQT